MTSKTFIAADPGGAGSVAWSNRSGVQVVDMPESRAEIIKLVQGILKEDADLGSDGAPVAYVERITGFIPDGGASQMFQFGVAVERIGCIIETLGVRLLEVTPQCWQKSLDLGTKGTVKVEPWMKPDEKAELKKHNALLKRQWKGKLKDEAARLFPGCRVTLKTCDSLLILRHAIAVESQNLL